jgi:hypothetical protein
VTLVAACNPPANPLVAARDRDDRRAIRAHGWTLWEQLARGPVWERWFRSDVVFSDAPLVPSGELVFRAPRPITANGVLVEPAMEHQLYFVVLNPAAAEHVRAHGLQHRGVAKVPDFPIDAVALKLVWYPIHGPTEVPVWDGTAARDDTAGNPPSTWPRTVTVTPGNLDRFYHRPLVTDREVASARAAWHDDSLVAGDEVVLVGVHATTKAIPDWTWETYWWHDGADAFAADRPAIDGWAASYDMDVTFAAGTACMNPWLEARFPDGLTSNCLTCHAHAREGAREFLPVPQDRGAVTNGTDFMWSVALESK